MQPPTLVQQLRCDSEVSCAALQGGRLCAGAGCALLLWQWRPGAGGSWHHAGRALGAHRYGVTAVQWGARGGRLLASGGVDGALRVWARSLEPRRLLAAPGAPSVRALHWAGARLLAGHDDGLVRVWLWARGLLLAAVAAAGGGALHALCVSGPLVLAACTEGVLKVWSLRALVRGEALQPLLWVDGAHDLGALCAAANGQLAATGGHDGLVRLWVLTAAPTAAATLAGHAAAVTALCWSGALLASSSLDRSARVWSVLPAGCAASCLLVVAAHERYLTAVALSPCHRLLLTASNDRHVRSWALDGFTPDIELDVACTPQLHYGTGDLQGIEPVGDELVQRELDDVTGAGDDTESEEARGAARLVTSEAHGGAVNSIVTAGDLLATASSDGCVRVFTAGGGRLQPVVTVGGDGYPLLALDVGGALLAAGGLGGSCQLLLARDGTECGARSVSGGGAVRAVRLHQQLMLLAADSGLVLLYDVTDTSPHPMHTYSGHCGAALCVCWLPQPPADRPATPLLCASADEAGTLLLHAPPPNARTLLKRPDAHELGVMSMDAAPYAASRSGALLATAGCDGTLKLWLLHCTENAESVSLHLSHVISAAGGGMSCVRWGRAGGRRGALLAGGGAERWARVWRVHAPAGGGVRVRHVAAAPVRHAGGALSVQPMEDGYLAVGTMSGELSVWELPALRDEDGNEDGDEEEQGANSDLTDDKEEEEWCLEEQWDAEPRWWGRRGVMHWLTEYVGGEGGGALCRSARVAGLTGERLVIEPIDEIVDVLMDGVAAQPISECSAASGVESLSSLRSRLVEELQWLRAPPPPPHLTTLAPHSLLCPLSHSLMHFPARAADGLTYERAALREWFIEAGGCVSFISGRRLRSSHVSLNRGVLVALRAFLRENDAGPPSDPPTEFLSDPYSPS